MLFQCRHHVFPDGLPAGRLEAIPVWPTAIPRLKTPCRFRRKRARLDGISHGIAKYHPALSVSRPYRQPSCLSLHAGFACRCSCHALRTPKGQPRPSARHACTALRSQSSRPRFPPHCTAASPFLRRSPACPDSTLYCSLTADAGKALSGMAVTDSTRRSDLSGLIEAREDGSVLFCRPSVLFFRRFRHHASGIAGTMHQGGLPPPIPPASDHGTDRGTS